MENNFVTYRLETTEDDIIAEEHICFADIMDVQNGKPLKLHLDVGFLCTYGSSHKNPTKSQYACDSWDVWHLLQELFPSYAPKRKVWEKMREGDGWITFNCRRVPGNVLGAMLSIIRYPREEPDMWASYRYFRRYMGKALALRMAHIFRGCKAGYLYYDTTSTGHTIYSYGVGSNNATPERNLPNRRASYYTEPSLRGYMSLCMGEPIHDTLIGGSGRAGRDRVIKVLRNLIRTSPDYKGNVRWKELKESLEKMDQVLPKPGTCISYEGESYTLTKDGLLEQSVYSYSGSNERITTSYYKPKWGRRRAVKSISLVSTETKEVKYPW